MVQKIMLSLHVVPFPLSQFKILCPRMVILSRRRSLHRNFGPEASPGAASQYGGPGAYSAKACGADRRGVNSIGWYSVPT